MHISLPWPVVWLLVLFISSEMHLVCLPVLCNHSHHPLPGKLDQARELSGLLLAAYPGDASVTMLQAVLLAKSGKVRQP
jgi:hypothetical protein